ncbi:hypothetical protein L1887_53046 [Cichorium endivia]|nr:hypothetical protein L1887_53046 [Cichorium endivia]
MRAHHTDPQHAVGSVLPVSGMRMAGLRAPGRGRRMESTGNHMVEGGVQDQLTNGRIKPGPGGSQRRRIPPSWLFTLRRVCRALLRLGLCGATAQRSTMVVSQHGMHRSGSLKRPAVQKPTAPTISIPQPPALSEGPTYPPSDYLADGAEAGPSRPTSIPRRPVLSRRRTSKKDYVHPYLSGNFAPVTTECPLTDCLYEGTIPEEFAGSQYVRNGGNPLANSELDRDAHWFDADGMLAGVLFRRTPDGSIQPCFLNRFILTDLLLSTPEHSRLPYLPSIATLVNPHVGLLWLMLEILRTFVLTILTWLPGLGPAKRPEAAPHQRCQHQRVLARRQGDGRLRERATHAYHASWPRDCRLVHGRGRRAQHRPQGSGQEARGKASKGFGGGPPIVSMLREFTTAHPKVDPHTQELLLYHMCFEPPYLRVSVIAPAEGRRKEDAAAGQDDQRTGGARPQTAQDDARLWRHTYTHGSHRCAALARSDEPRARPTPSCTTTRLSLSALV